MENLTPIWSVLLMAFAGLIPLSFARHWPENATTTTQEPLFNTTSSEPALNLTTTYISAPTTTEPDFSDPPDYPSELKDLQNLTLAKLEAYRIELSALLTSVEEQIRFASANESFVEGEMEEEPLNATTMTSVTTTATLFPVPFRDFVSPPPAHLSSSSSEPTTTPTFSTTSQGSLTVTPTLSPSSTTQNATTTTPTPATSTSSSMSNATSTFTPISSTREGESEVEEGMTTEDPPTSSEKARTRSESKERKPVLKTFKIQRKTGRRGRKDGGGSYAGWSPRCTRLSQAQLVAKLKAQGTYNPDYMAWDVPGVIRFLEIRTLRGYDKVGDPPPSEQETDDALEKNLGTLERILKELRVPCDVRSPQTLQRLYNITAEAAKSREEGKVTEKEREKDRLRVRRGSTAAYLDKLYHDEPVSSKRGGVIG